MDKSYGIKKRKYIHKNKRKKYCGFDNIGCLNKVGRMQRRYIKSYINFIKNKDYLLHDLFCPVTTGRIFTWWDDVPRPTKISKLHRI